MLPRYLAFGQSKSHGRGQLCQGETLKDANRANRTGLTQSPMHEDRV
jgi:hypothetical protein